MIPDDNSFLHLNSFFPIPLSTEGVGENLISRDNGVAELVGKIVKTHSSV